MLRLDRFLCEMNIGSRSQVKVYLKQGLVKVNNETVIKPEHKVNETKDVVTYRGETLKYSKFAYYMLNKPAGVVSATQDNTCKTVSELLKDTGHKDLFPAGRLDKDTEGLLLMTNDGDLAHNLLSPKKHVSKVYYVNLERPLSGQDIRKLEEGVDIGEERPTLPASVEIITDTSIYLTITEGKFHQIKRMLTAVNNKVTYLKRIAMGGLILDNNLPVGNYRELTKEEIEIIQMNSGE